MKFESFETTVIGREFKVGPVIMRKEKMISFANEYDPLPLHYDEEYAKTTRYKGLIAPGVMSFMSLWAEFIKDNIWGDNMIGGKKTTIEWFAPIYPGDSVRGTCVITGKTRRNPYNGIVEITSEFYNQDDVHVMRDVTEMIVSG